MNPYSEIQVTPEQERTALQWLSVLHDQPDSGDQATFSRWLQADPAHAQAYAQAQVIWELSEVAGNTLANEEALMMQRYLSQINARRRTRLTRWSSGLAVAACLVLMVGVFAGWQPLRWFNDLGADFVSAPGQVRTLALADQTEVTLGADSAIAVNFSGNERHVELRRGVAFFHVTHTGQPFVVEADGGEAQVLGTEFEVRLQPTGAQVTVLTGWVGVKADKNASQQILTADQQVAYASGRADRAHRIDSAAQLAWRTGWLTYYKTPLVDVISDLKRYYPGQIVLLNTALGERRISGSFPSQDPQAVINSLQGVLGFEQHNAFGRVIVLR
ncbi:sugar ABC transporter substrate-binding protein [Pseudomonas endophytica]|uniref:Sugar ABC transporter substrate-binding protein n=1 Tax=Pseudomonas endophytica TaxID=1563157 RepID=A0A0Q0YV79_9PSED|nr:FecR domain-containing protein [Pseudomonas endophytica]KQB53128.1 sugar ABC transporter substrate-binding protein [Pseudomonas endophytica]